jgi:hypothetical protein
MEDLSKLSGPPIWGRLGKWYTATKRRMRQRLRQRLARPNNVLEFQQHRYPDISIEETRSRLAKFQQILGKDGDLKVDQIYPKLFRIRRSA